MKITARNVSRCVHPDHRQAARMSRSLLLAAASFFLGSLGRTAAADFTARLERPPAGVSRAQFELWVPDSLGPKAMRAVIAVPDYEGGRTIHDDAAWRQFAEQTQCAVLRYVLERPEPQLKLAKGVPAAAGLEAGLEELARLAARPELARVPWVLTGLSQSAWQAQSIANERPERTLAVLAWHAATSARAPEVYLAPQGHAVPMLHLMAGQERFPISMESFVRDACLRGAVWTYQLQVGVPHQRLGDPSYPLVWLGSVLAQRLADDGALKVINPAHGWRATLVAYEPVPGDRRIAKADIFPPSKDPEDGRPKGGNRDSVFWLPDETSARAWLAAFPVEPPTGH
jgi:hypothetical protein